MSVNAQQRGLSAELHQALLILEDERKAILESVDEEEHEQDEYEQQMQQQAAFRMTGGPQTFDIGGESRVNG